VVCPEQGGGARFGTQRPADVIDVVVEPEGRDRLCGAIPRLGLAVVFGSIAKRLAPARMGAVGLVTPPQLAEGAPIVADGGAERRAHRIVTAVSREARDPG